MARSGNMPTTSSNRKAPRAARALAAAWLLAGCSGISNGDVTSIYKIAKNVVSGGSQKVTLEEAAAQPYASMGLRLDGGPQTMIILASDTSGDQLWTSSARIAITTHDGRIVRTAGLGHDLGGLQSRIGPPGPDGARVIVAQADFPDLKLYAVPIACRDKPAGEETIAILGKDIHTLLIDESCVSKASELRWSFHNKFWIDSQSGLVWRSIQHVNPKLDALETEILRPPG